MKQLAEKFKSQFKFIGENDGKWYYFLVPIKKERDNDKAATYKLKFIDSFRYMPTSLTNIVDNLSGIYKKIQSAACLEEKHAKRKSIQSECDFIDLKNNKLRYKFKECKKIWLKPING